MRFAYIISDNCGVAPFNGIRVQAKTWADEIARQGHVVELVSPWYPQNWGDYDAIHIFGQYEGTHRVVSALYKYNKNIFFSPIVDTNQPVWKYWLASHLSISKLRLDTLNSIVRKSDPYIKKWIVRSQYEYNYVNKAYCVDRSKIEIIPLSYRIRISENLPEKEDFCLHVSKLTDERKNVSRLIQAAIKYKFKLLLAGSISNDKEFEKYRKQIDRNENIEYLGRVSDEVLLDLYRRAKVFALPSINEGVGMVAVEAAANGCNIVITNVGGPKEYYNGMASEVNPYSVDEIGTSILYEMDNNSNEKLRQYVIENFNLSVCVRKLINTYY